MKRKLGLLGTSKGATWLLAACCLGGCASIDSSPDPVRAAYTQYLDAIDRARDTVQRSPGIRPGHEAEDLREGELFLRAIVNASVTWALIDTPETPIVALVPRPSDRLGLNNPDNLYYWARVADDRSYVLFGDRGLARTFAIQAMKGLPGLTREKGLTLSYLNGRDLEVDDGGRFVIALSRERPEDASANWLELKPGVDVVLLRLSFQDWAREHAEPGSLSIAVEGGSEARPTAITPDLAAGMLEDAATSIAEQAEYYSRAYAAARQRGVNRVFGPSRADGSQATASHQWSMIGVFDLEPDETMVVTVKDAPNALYFNFETANAWMNTYEFVHHQSSLNRSQMQVGDDGYIRLVVSPIDPGVRNWIDTTGQTQGWIWSRWQEVKGQLGPEFAPRSEVVKRDALRSVLPANTPVVTPEQRKAELALRAEQLRQRFTGANPALPEILRRLHALEALVGERLAEASLEGPVID